MLTIRNLSDVETKLNAVTQCDLKNHILDLLKSYVDDEDELEDFDMFDEGMGEIVVLDNNDSLTSLPVESFLGQDLSDPDNVLPEFVEELQLDNVKYYSFTIVYGNEAGLVLLVPYNKEKFTEQLMQKIEKYNK